jgi:altronate hydrolase
MTTEQQAGCSIRLPEQSSAAQLAVLQVHQRDNVLVALQALQAGEPLPAPFSHLSAQTAVPAGHKLALTAIAAGEPVLKYGFAIGRATQPAWFRRCHYQRRLAGKVRRRGRCDRSLLPHQRR